MSTKIRRTALLALLAATLLAPATATASAWDKPAQTSPAAVDLSKVAGTVYHDSFRYSGSQDVYLYCSTNPVTMPNWFEVIGGHNIIVEGCDFQTQGRSLKLQGQTGIAWVHDVHFEAMPGQILTEGIDLQEPSPATVVLRDVLIDELHGSYRTNHADCVQSWSGPQRFLIDGLSCTSGYQGLFLLPNQWDSTTNPTAWDFRNIDLSDNGYSLWLGNLNEGTIPTWNVQGVFASPLATWDGTADGGAAWASAQAGAPPSGHFVWPSPGGATGIDEPSIPVLAGEQ